MNKEGQDNHQNEQNDTGFIPHSKQKNQFQILYELKCERQNSKAYERKHPFPSTSFLQLLLSSFSFDNLRYI